MLRKNMLLRKLSTSQFTQMVVITNFYTGGALLVRYTLLWHFFCLFVRYKSVFSQYG